MTKGRGTGATALKNAFRGREHKERSQLKSRKHLGLLQKKKDYKDRAKSFKKKRARLRSMREEARTRNPDEFHTGMINTVTDEHGRHLKTEAPKKKPQQQRENAGNLRYLRHKSNVDGGVIKQLRSDITMSAAAPANNHTIFVDDEQDAEDFDAAEFFDTLPELVARPATRARRSKLASVDVTPPDANTVQLAAAKYHELSERVRRKSKIDSLVGEVQLRQNLLGKGRRQKVRGSEGTVTKQFKWTYERKR
eukprot:Hpha_TRINITY_DN9551_c0_g1::TRINITY_DN9551_c0_g1_i1::g.115013::m.115013/K14769/UTP11; U3 small nucleolar RNA-associated protein 11